MKSFGFCMFKIYFIQLIKTIPSFAPGSGHNFFISTPCPYISNSPIIAQHLIIFKVCAQKAHKMFKGIMLIQYITCIQFEQIKQILATHLPLIEYTYMSRQLHKLQDDDSHGSESGQQYASEEENNNQQQSNEQSHKKYEHHTLFHNNNFNAHQYNTFHPKQTRIDYSKGIDQYLNKVSTVINLQRSLPNSQLKQSPQKELQDREIQSIINQVLNKRKRQSRISNGSDFSQEDVAGIAMYGHRKNNISNTSTHIDIVNQRLRKQNEDLAKNIKKLTNKINQFNHISHSSTSNNKSKIMNNTSKSAVSTPNTSAHASNIIDEKQKQLEKLRQRLQKVEKANSRMQLQLSKLQLSRKTNKSRLKSLSQRNELKQAQQNYQINIKCGNCPGPSKTVSRRPTQQGPSNPNSPLKKDYYSPIMQFQQYSLNNQPTVSMYDGTMQRTSQFGINLMPSQQRQFIQVAEKETEAAIGWMECLQEQKQLDDEIRALQEIIRKNNVQISKYQGIFMKRIL